MTAASKRERPILFSGPMVRAILDRRKTQTRRVVRMSPSVIGKPERAPAACGSEWHWRRDDGTCEWHLDCPFGVSGDRLWVRESFRISGHDDCSRSLAECATREHCHYRADLDEPPAAPGQWKPAIFMPRQISRLTLEIEAVRVELLQSISREDCIAEGCPAEEWYRVDGGPEKWYRSGWDSLNGKRAPWASNPFVFVLSFRRVA